VKGDLGESPESGRASSGVGLSLCEEFLGAADSLPNPDAVGTIHRAGAAVVAVVAPDRADVIRQFEERRKASPKPNHCLQA
jgi:hypothetical protein